MKPVRPSLEQLRDEAETLHTEERIALSDAQEKLARSYGAPNWPRLVQSCELIDAIWLDDLEAVRKLIEHNPNLLHENARIIKDNWGPPLTYAANLGRNEGGHTALFGTVVSQPNFWMNYNDRGPYEAPFTQLLLERGADPKIKASLRKKLHEGYAPKYNTENTYEYRDVTALE